MVNKVMGISLGDNYQAESDMRTLLEAVKIKKDAKRFKAAKAMAMQRYEEMEESGLTDTKEGTAGEEDAEMKAEAKPKAKAKPQAKPQSKSSMYK